MAIAFVQSNTVTVLGGTSLAPALTGVGAGNFLVAVVSYYYVTAGSPPAAPSGWSVAIAPSPQDYFGPKIGFGIYYRENVSSGSHNPTFTLPSGSYGASTLFEFSGVATSSSLDVTTSNGGNAGSTTAINTGTTSTTGQANELVIAGFGYDEQSGANPVGFSTPGATGYTSRAFADNGSANVCYDHDYKIVSATGTQTAGWTKPSYGGGQAWQSCIATFKEAGGGGGVSGTLARTNASDTLSAVGKTTQVGTLSRTNANDTLAATGTSTRVGTLARTNANDTLAASGSTTITGTLNRTAANDTLAASGSSGVAVSGSLARTNANDTLSAAGTQTQVGSLNRTNGNDTLAASGSPIASGSSSTTNGNDVLVASGSAGIAVSGTLNRAENPDTLAAVGKTTILGTLARTGGNDTLAASGTSGTPVVGAVKMDKMNLKVSRAMGI